MIRESLSKGNETKSIKFDGNLTKLCSRKDSGLGDI